MSVKSEHPDRPSEMMVGGVCEIHPDICLFFGRRFRSVAPQSWREGFERCRCALFVSNALLVHTSWTGILQRRKR